MLQAFRNYRKFTAFNAQQLPVGFYSEMGSDRLYYEEIIRRLVEEHRQPVLYLTSSESDVMLGYRHPDFHSVFIGDGFFRTLAFREINTRVFVMTMPDLDTFHLKRSVYPVHYVYLFHALVSTHMVYRDRAFDAYDSIFCVGPHHEAEIREAEALSGASEKRLVRHGYPRVEKIIAEYEAYDPDRVRSDQRTRVLVAPTWGANSITNICLEKLLRLLLAADDFEVTFRPHPMTSRDESALLRRVEAEFGVNARFHLDFDIARTESFFEADVMISDWSGVAIEFALATRKPVLYVDVPAKVNNKNFGRFTSVPVEKALRGALGAIVELDRLDEVVQRIRELGRDAERAAEIGALLSRLVFNLGHSSEVGAQEIVRLIDESKSRHRG